MHAEDLIFFLFFLVFGGSNVCRWQGWFVYAMSGHGYSVNAEITSIAAEVGTPVQARTDTGCKA